VAWSTFLPTQHDLEAGKKAFRSYDFGRVGVTGQCDCLASGSKHANDCAIFDLVSIAIVACADLCRKSKQELDPLVEVGILKVRVHSHRQHILLPVIPICLPAVGSHLQ